MGMTVKEDRALQRNSFARRHLDADMEAQQGLERIHLQTIRNEKMKLQKELDKMRTRGHQRILGRRQTAVMRNNTARLSQLQLNREPSGIYQGKGLSQSMNGGNRSLKTPGRSKSPMPGLNGELDVTRAPLEAIGRGRDRHIVELPAINSTGRSPRPGGRSPRNGYQNRPEIGEDYIREQQMLEHKRNINKKQEELLARVEKFGEDMGQKYRNGSGELRQSPSERSDTKSDDNITVSSDPSASFPPGRSNVSDAPAIGSSRRKSDSYTEYNMKSIKNSITQTLVGEEKVQSEPVDAPTENPKLGRTISTTTSMGGIRNAKLRKKKISVENEPRRKGMPLNIDVVFDQETYAPDGSLRTMHMLPDPEECFEEAKKARYLRWRGPNNDDVELTVNQIFGKNDAVLSRKESTTSLMDGTRTNAEQNGN